MAKSNSIRIGIDVSPLSDGNSTRGVGYYTKNLVSSLNQEIKTNPRFNHFQVELITSKNELRSQPYDLIHYPYFDPFYLTLPGNLRPFVVTVHDLIPIQYHQHFPVGIKGSLKWLIQKHRLKQASGVITVSNSSKDNIINLTSIPDTKVFPIYPGADDSFYPITNQKTLQSISTKYHLPKKFVLFVGDINWNKNIRTLVTACLRLKYPLVIVGSSATKTVPIHPWTTDIHWLQLQAKNHSELLTLTGFVADADLPAIFNLATIYCQPSYAEGFGLPLVQAMQSGCPVCYSNCDTVAEVMNQCGQPFDPFSIESLKLSLSQLWLSSTRRQQLRRQGLKRAGFFSWSQTAISTLSVYQQIIDSQR